MDDTYRFLRRVEHRLQILFDRQTHEMPRSLEELRTLAIRMGYVPPGPGEDRASPAHRFLADYRSKTEVNRRILNHILHDAFQDDDGSAADPVVDLVLDPHPSEEQIAEVLGRYPFRDRQTAYHNLMALAREDFPFLSQARCRHFLAAIAPRLLQAVGAHARPRHDPDEPREGLGVAGRQGDPLGAVQLQPAQPAALRRAVCDQPVPLRRS